MSGITFFPAFKDDGTDISPVFSPRNLDMGAGGFKDEDVLTAIPLGDAAAATIETISPSIVGGINENKGRIDFLEGVGAFTTKTDPALDAISASDIDDFVGCSILLTAAGNDQNLPNPTDTAVWHQYIVINDDASTDSIDIIGSSTKTLSPGEFAKFIWDGSAWISISGGTLIWIDDGTDIKAVNSTRNLDLQGGLLKIGGVDTLSKSGDIVTIAGLTVDVTNGKITNIGDSEQDGDKYIKTGKRIWWTSDGSSTGLKQGGIDATIDNTLLLRSGINIKLQISASGVVTIINDLNVNESLTLNQLTAGVVRSDANGELSSSPTLADGTLGATQSQDDDSTKLATTEYVDRTQLIRVTAKSSNDSAELVDSFRLIEYDTSGGAREFTLPQDSVVDFPIGCWIELSKTHTNDLTIKIGAGATFRGLGGDVDYKLIGEDGFSAFAHKTAANTWKISGSIEVA